MRIPHYWPLPLMKAVLAFAFCHQALGYDIGVSSLLTLMALHPVTLAIPGLLCLHAIVNAQGMQQLATILMPLTALAALIWIVRDPDVPATPSIANRAAPLTTGT
jgi:hypothetical protein